MMTHDEIIEVVKADKEGKPIQFRRLHRINGESDEWRNVLQPGWDFANNEYRAEPEPFEAWVVIGSDGVIISAWMSKKIAESDSIHHKGSRVIRMIEAEEGGEP